MTDEDDRDPAGTTARAPRAAAATAARRGGPVPVIVNAMSGTVLRSSVDEQREAIRRGAAAAGREVEIAFVDPDDVEDALREAAKARPELIVCGGGDGTMSTAAGILHGSGTALGALPLGTCNFLARQLGFSTDVETATRQLLEGRRARMDLGSVNDHTFINAATIGIYIDVVKAREKRRRETGESRWFASTGDLLRVLFRMPAVKLRIRESTAQGWIRTPFVFVGNNEYGESPAEFGARKRIDGGELVLMRARSMTFTHVLNVLWNFCTGRLRRSPWVETIVGEEILVESRRRQIELSIDGDRRVLRPPLRFRSLPRALEVMIARERAPDAPEMEEPAPS